MTSQNLITNLPCEQLQTVPMVIMELGATIAATVAALVTDGQDRAAQVSPLILFL